MSLTGYRSSLHRAGCVALFDGHVGGAFGPEERDGFIAFLDELPGPYLVLTEGGEVLACGGIAYEDEENALASVCWTLVHPLHQRRGLGSRVVEACVDAAQADPRCTALRLETVPETAGFFKRMGFHIERVEPDGYGPGKTRVEMRRALGPG